MSPGAVGFLVGAVFGGCGGVIIMAALVAGSRADDQADTFKAYREGLAHGRAVTVPLPSEGEELASWGVGS